MEKFTVDLEKVLDDFEFSEERQERRASTGHNTNVKSQHSGPKNVHTTYEYPNPIPYRRPPFEPINLADADFSAAIPPLLANQQSGNFQPVPGNHGPANQKPVSFQSLPRHHSLANQQPGNFQPVSGNHCLASQQAGYYSGHQVLANQNPDSIESLPEHHNLANQQPGDFQPIPGNHGLANQQTGYHSGHQVLANQKPDSFESIPGHHNLANQQAEYHSEDQVLAHQKPDSFESLPGHLSLANQQAEYHSEHQVLASQNFGDFQSASGRHILSNQQPGNFQSAHQVSTSYVLPHMSSGAHVIQKTPNLDMSTSSSGLVQNRTTPAMASGSHMIQNSLDQIYLSPCLDTILSGDLTNLDLSLDTSDVIKMDDATLSGGNLENNVLSSEGNLNGTVLSNDSNVDLSLDNVLSSDDSSEAGDNTVEQPDKQYSDQQPGRSTLDQRPSLPDVATATHMQPPGTLDLINDRVLSAIVDSSSSEARPIGFGAVSKPALSESELNKYLDELEDENSVEEVSSLPVVSTDDEVSSTQSQMDETFTSTTSSSGGNGKPCVTNSEFENLLSPESSTESHNPSESDHVLQSNPDASHRLLEDVERKLDVNLDASHSPHGNLDASQTMHGDPNQIPHGNADPNQTSLEDADPNKMSHENRNAGYILRGKADAIIDSNPMLSNEIDASRCDGQMLRGNVNAGPSAPVESIVDPKEMLSSSLYVGHKLYNIDAHNIQVHLNPSDEASFDGIETHPAYTDKTPGSLNAKLEEVTENVATIPELKEESEESLKDISKDEIPNDEIKYKEPYLVKEDSEDTRTNCEGDSLPKAKYTDEISFDNNVNTMKGDTKVDHIDEEKIEPNKIERNDEPREQNNSCVNNVEEQTSNEREEVIEQNQHNKALESSGNFETADDSLVNKPEELRTWNDGLPNVSQVVETGIGLNDSPAEIINTNYVVEISQPHLLVEPINKNTSPQKSIVDNEAKYESTKEYSNLNNIDRVSSSIGEENNSSKTNEDVANKLENNRDSSCKENIQHVQNNLNENSSVRKSSNTNLSENENNLTKQECNLNLKCNNADSKTNVITEINEGVNVNNVYKVSNSAIEDSNGPSWNSNEKFNPNRETNDKYRNNFVHNDLEKTREKNTNVLRERNETALIASCITVSNLKQLDPKSSVSSSTASSVSSSIISSITNSASNVSSNTASTCVSNSTTSNVSITSASTVSASANSSTIDVERTTLVELNDASSSIAGNISNVSSKTSSSSGTISTGIVPSSTLVESSDASNTAGNISNVPSKASSSSGNISTSFASSSSLVESNAASRTAGFISNEPSSSENISASVSLSVAPRISISSAPSSTDRVEIHHEVVSPDCYVEEKSIADSIQNNICDSGTARIEQSQNRPVLDDATNPRPSTPEPSEPPPYSTGPKPVRPNSLDLPSSPSVSLSPSENSANISDSELPPTSVNTAPSEAGGGEGSSAPSRDSMLGRRAPYWVPDIEAPACMHCQAKFTLVKRRHHCRACGQVLCSRCCSRRAPLEYLQFSMERVCTICHELLVEQKPSGQGAPPRPNPNNPMEYCSTIPPLQQIAASGSQPPPSVLVPVSVLKREGSLKSSREGKQVMFSDGIKPGGDLTELDAEREVSKLPIVRKARTVKRVGTPPGNLFHRRPLHPDSNSFVPAVGLPPLVVHNGVEITYSEINSPIGVNEPGVKFAIHRNLFAHVKKVKLDCCVGKKKVAWNITSQGLSCVGQDEVVFLLGCTPGEVFPPRHIFLVLLHIYTQAAQGSTVTEMSYLPPPPSTQELLGSKEHGGFLFIRQAGQCVTHLVLPEPPYLFGLLVHRWEIPWAKLFPLRLILRLGAATKCYPCPLLSVRFREPVYLEVGHTIIKLLADFRSFGYTLPTVRGLLIHMEATRTSVIIPKNFYDQVVKAMNHSNESHLAFAGNFSATAGSHLVCVQNEEEDSAEYSTQRIERPGSGDKNEACTGLAFILFNASLKSSDGMQGKACIREDGLMVHLLPEGMVALRAALLDMRPYIVSCGPRSEESVHIVWSAQDLNFNVGVRSCIDGRALDGVQSIRVHGGTDYTGALKLIRWTEVFILENSDLDGKSTEDPIDHMKKLSDSISRATCVSLVPLLDSLSGADVSKFAVRVSIHPEDVGYEAGTGGERFDPKYMRHLDEGLVPVIHQAAVHSTSPLTLELVFRIMEQG